MIQNEGESMPLEQRSTEQQPESQPNDEIIDPIKELQLNMNPIPLIAVIDQVDLEAKNEEGVPIFNLLCNKFLPLGVILEDKKFKFHCDEDGRGPLHYAVAVDDVKAAYECLKRGAENKSDNFGNTPIEDAIKYGHRRSFLLCLHFQHFKDNLAHVAAKYNRVWQLRALQSLGLDLEGLDDHTMTPLQIAVESYSYEAAQYLMRITNKVNIRSLKNLTDSDAMMRRMNRVDNEKKSFSKVWLPVISKLLSLLVIFIAVNNFPCFQLTQSSRNIQIGFALFLYLLMPLLSSVCSKKKKDFESILHLLKEPHFPVIGEICPSCMGFADTDYDHCDQCKSCVHKFHQHNAFCINKSNEVIWYAFEYFWAWVLGSLLSQAIDWRRILVFTTDVNSTKIFEFFKTVDYCLQRDQFILAVFLVLLGIMWIQQCLFCLQLFGMAFMNRTYQQVVKSEKYPFLFEAWKTKEGKIKLKEQRMFMRWKLLGGILLGVKNILLYFF